MAINLCGQMDLFSMLGDISGKPYNNMTISADIPSAFSGKTENENSDNLDDYLSVEEKILTLLKKKKEMKLTTNSEIYSIFSKKKIEEEDMEYISDKLEDYLRELLLDCVPGNVQEEDFRLSDTLEDLMWYSPAADYIRHFDFINRGNMACSQFQIIGTRGVKPYYQLIGYESYSLEYLKTYKPLRKHIKDSVNSYLCLPFDERVSRLVEQFNNVCYNEYLSLYNWVDHISKDMDATRIDNDVAKYVKECMCELPVEIIHKLASLPLIDWLDNVTIMRIPNTKKKNMPIDFFSNLSYFNVFYGLLPFDLINLYTDEKYYYLVFLDYFLDDSECRISTNIDFGFLNPESLMLFKEFNAIA